MTLKLLFDPHSGRVLGAQAVGGAGVDKRIDVLAVAIQAGMTVFDLEEMELAYSPQYGSAKDPINMAGLVAGGLLRGEHPQVDVEAVLAAPAAERPLLLDVRTPQEHADGHIPEAVNIPVDELRSRLGELPQGRDIAVYCQVGQRGYLATRILRQAGLAAANIGGGYKTFRLFNPKANERCVASRSGGQATPP
jgi:rhodanese-related sulfurtransferase